MNQQQVNFGDALNMARNEARAGVINRETLALNRLLQQMERERALKEELWVHSHSNWVLLRNTTRNQILNGRISQMDSHAITAVTIANNIPRRSMEFVTIPVYKQEEDADDADY
jgi:hypothetical protein